ncbi:YafY family transcriptional regulator [Endozoicomonas sp. SM1973]|uniref:YafY family transcriptional regulator n=1 Tax=Spartinivicinus marinus TaxID=2994442 RepID=A0A853I9K8_9GAMM|nr:YafY family protein [Spartinivicinus marinus]MCX4025234.1 YafY family protein [Spartinivicinus marinus]NYZ65955.1 YafY family transcriptional regulator [Spartinivicinus marinus]
MRRSDRLFQIVQIIRHRQWTTAAYLAERLEVSERTIYRDMQDLQLSGVPVISEAGYGYQLDQSFNFPPLQFTEEELTALVLGLQLTIQCTDQQLQHAAESVLHKVKENIPAKLLTQIQHNPLGVPFPLHNKQVSERIEPLRKATVDKQKVTLDYLDEKQQASTRTIRPLQLYFWGKVWTLTAWCELRNDFRNFRLDRVQQLTLQNSYFLDEPGKRLSDFNALMESREEH